MHRPFTIPFWKQAPFIRLLLPLVSGIILQWYASFHIFYILHCISCFAISYTLLKFLPGYLRFKTYYLPGILLHLLIAAAGMLLTWQNIVSNNKNWYGYHINDSSSLLLSIDEPIVEKAKSFKTRATVKFVLNNNNAVPVKGKLLLYFAKDSSRVYPAYGDYLLCTNNLQWIKNSGNPGAFNYERYALFQGYYHQAFLKNNSWKIISQGHGNLLYQFIYKAQQKVIKILKTYVSGKDELGIAEALLIGYKEDLDKDLVQAYSNTGVVHIIAISGMHLALIYFLLLWIFNHVPFLKDNRIIKAFFIIISLWMFALLTGASASVLRSAVMFSFLVMGKLFYRNASIYNSLAASAFVLLIYNPFLLWDVGFQLSYLAITGIAAIHNPLFRCWFIRNRALRKIWELISISLAAQLATFPICIYYFHQFPNLFLITNLFAVPLSTILVYTELLLLLVSPVAWLATVIGKLLAFLIYGMNYLIRYFNSFSFSVWDNIYSSVLSTLSLYAFLFFTMAWLLQKNKLMLRYSLSCLLIFTLLSVQANFYFSRQKKLIVYNVPKHTAIDYLAGNHYFFIGDSLLNMDGLLRNFHLKPARISQHATTACTNCAGIQPINTGWQIYNKKIIIIDSSITFENLPKKIKIDMLLLTNNSKSKIKDLVTALQPSIIVFDASNSLWKIANWKKECEQLALHYYSVPEQGAYVFNIQ